MITFTAPQWRWRAAPERKKYLLCDNEVRVCPVGKKEYSVFVVVPSEFFMYVEQLMSGDRLAAAMQKGVSFYLDQSDDKKEWLFGFYVKGGYAYQDLWRYTPSTVPTWAKVK